MQIVLIEVRKRGFFGWVFLIVFLAFNAMMVLVMVPVVLHALNLDIVGLGLTRWYNTLLREHLFLSVCGAIIFGMMALVTRGRKTYIEERFDD